MHLMCRGRVLAPGGYQSPASNLAHSPVNPVIHACRDEKVNVTNGQLPGLLTLEVGRGLRNLSMLADGYVKLQELG